MSEFLNSLKKQVENIQTTPINSERFLSESEFNKIGVELLIEVGSYTCIAACLLPNGAKQWNRNQAVIGGNIVRLYKLISALLDQTCQRRREISFIISRLAFETIVNLSYLIKNFSPDTFNSYVQYSLQHEKKLYNKINENIKERGSEIAIETRMLNSIQQAFNKSETKIEDVLGNLKNWDNKTIFQRAESVDLKEAYLGVFGGGSHSIHGNWMDLLDYHLEYSGSGFTPKLEWRNPRPQILYAIALLSTRVILQYLEFLNVQEAITLIKPRLENLIDRIIKIDDSHEEFLQETR